MTPARGWRTRVRALVPVVGFAAFAVLSVAIPELDHRQGVATLEETVVAVDNLVRLRMAVSQAVVAAARGDEGDPTQGAFEELARLDEAAGALDDLLAGRSALVAFRDGARPPDIPGIRGLVERYRGLLVETRAAALGRGGVRDPVAERVRLQELNGVSLELERATYAWVGTHLAARQNHHALLLGGWAGVLLLATLGLWRVRGTRRRALLGEVRAERGRRAAERRYAALERRAAVGVLEVDGAGEVLTASPWWARTLGMEEGACVGKGWWEMLASDDDGRSRGFWKERAGLGHPFTQDVRLTDASGSSRVLTGRWAPGQRATWVGAFVDVTEQRAVEEQLRQAQKLEAVGKLTGGVAHDFNNLLSVILTNAHLLLLNPDRLGTEEVQMLAEMEQAARSGAQLVKRLMTFSRRSELEIRPADLGALVAQAATLGKKLLREDVRLDLRLPTPGPAVHADARAVEQMVLNLMSNARDAMPRGGTLTITVDEAEADADFRGDRPWVAPGRYGRVTVSDDGVGMDAGVCAQVFEPFFTTKEEGKGTGLGLSTVQLLMRQHDGHAAVYSEPGVGTTFRLYFPAAVAMDEAEGAGFPAPPRPARVEGLSVLLVEDDLPLRITTERVLVRLGFVVTCAADGEEALEMLARPGFPCDLVLSDVSMEGMGGIELHRRMRRRGDARPFIFTSGLSDRELADRTSLPEGSRLLQKPWSVRELMRAVEELGLLAG